MMPPELACCPWPRPSGTCRPVSTRGTSSSARRPATTRASTSSRSTRSRRCPQVHWPDQEPLRHRGHAPERLNHWLTLVQRGEVLQLLPRVPRPHGGRAEPAGASLAQLVFAGLIDVQDRMLYNRSYTTGHKAYRARASDRAGRRDRLGPGAPRALRRRARHRGRARAGTRPTRWAATSSRTSSTAATTSCSRRTRPPDAGRGGDAGRRDRCSSSEPSAYRGDGGAAQGAAGARGGSSTPSRWPRPRSSWRRGEPNNFSMPQHGYEYCNTVRLVLRHLRPPAPAQAAVRGRLVHQPRRPSTRPTRPDNGPAHDRAAAGRRRRSSPRQLLERA